MATSLNTIISEIKSTALANGFVSVEELKINLKSNADTLLPKLFIRLLGVDYSDLLVSTANEDYKIELIIIIADSDNPVSDLKTLMDLLLNKMFTTNNLLSSMARSGKFNLINADLTNDRDLYAKLGGEGVTLRMDISNINNFGGTPCQ